MNRIMKLCISSLMSILCVCCFWGCKKGDDPEFVRQRVKRRTDIDIPENTEIIYCFYESHFQSYINTRVLNLKKRPWNCLKTILLPRDAIKNLKRILMLLLIIGL